MCADVQQHSGGAADSGEQAKRLLEEQNDEQISHLSLQISQLKQVRVGAFGGCDGEAVVDC